MTDLLSIAREVGAETGTSWVKFHSEAALAAFAERIRAEERADYERKLALQQASYEREMAAEVEAEREACAKICDSMQYADEQTPMNCAEAIRARGVAK